MKLYIREEKLYVFKWDKKSETLEDVQKKINELVDDSWGFSLCTADSIVFCAYSFS